MSIASSAPAQARTMQQYYRLHAAIYDATRWTFLHGRRRVLEFLPKNKNQTLVEVGCGTGHNLRQLARLHPDWSLIGIDVSAEMLAKASRATASCSRRVQLFEKPYATADFRLQESVDIILFSYALTMFNPGWEAAIGQAYQDLKPGGHIAVVDFHDTPHSWFRRWMGYNHVRMDAHLLPLLEKHFTPETSMVQTAWGGLWRYCIFVGKKV
ncbi:MAG: class I SAM-dependent methyltransferase [Lewinellaceae bacterium]|nr:class I SAM-dependent methyltransferase [Lewinellaceae bacterium]